MINHQIFNKKYTVKTNHNSHSSALLNHKEIINQTLALKPLRIEITNESGLFDEKPSNGQYMLYVIKEGYLKDINQLEKIDQLLEEFLVHLKSRKIA